jgi:hypothetical protein
MSSVKEDDKVSVLMMPHITSVYRRIQRIVLNPYEDGVFAIYIADGRENQV